MNREMIQIVTDEKTKKEFIEASKYLKISLSDFLRMCAIKEARKMKMEEIQN